MQPLWITQPVMWVVFHQSWSNTAHSGWFCKNHLAAEKCRNAIQPKNVVIINRPKNSTAQQRQSTALTAQHFSMELREVVSHFRSHPSNQYSIQFEMYCVCACEGEDINKKRKRLISGREKFCRWLGENKAYFTRLTNCNTNATNFELGIILWKQVPHTKICSKTQNKMQIGSIRIIIFSDRQKNTHTHRVNGFVRIMSSAIVSIAALFSQCYSTLRPGRRCSIMILLDFPNGILFNGLHILFPASRPYSIFSELIFCASTFVLSFRVKWKHLFKPA